MVLRVHCTFSPGSQYAYLDHYLLRGVVSIFQFGPGRSG
jgi:predicted metal-dependent enzyme (double-stranded beta helix superfamily)